MTTRIHVARLFLTTALLVGAVSAPAQTAVPTDHDKSIDLSVGDHTKVQQILLALQQGVSKHNPAAVATLVHYPIKVNPGNKPFTIKNEKEFVKDYDRIITSDIASAIYKQKYDNLFVNSEGAMIGDGEVWITGFCRDKSCKQSDIKIGTIQDTKNLKP